MRGVIRSRLGQEGRSPQVIALLCGQLVVLTDSLRHRTKSQIEHKGRQQPQHYRACYAEPHWHLNTDPKDETHNALRHSFLPFSVSSC